MVMGQLDVVDSPAQVDEHTFLIVAQASRITVAVDARTDAWALLGPLAAMKAQSQCSVSWTLLGSLPGGMVSLLLIFPSTPLMMSSPPP